MVTAITGDIGAGKSTASKLLAQRLKCDCVSADEKAKSLWLREDVKASAVNRFGDRILDSHGNINIRELSALVFSDECNHEFVDGLLHPLVMHELEELSLGHDDIVLEIPLLFEAGNYEWVDAIVYVAAEFDVRAKRCEVQRGWSINELLRRERFLLPREKRIAMSDYVIRNDTTINALESRINELGDKLHERKKRKERKEIWSSSRTQRHSRQI